MHFPSLLFNIGVAFNYSNVVSCVSFFQFSDGVYFIMLLGIFQDYFVPLYEYTLTPETFEQKVCCHSLLLHFYDYLEFHSTICVNLFYELFL